MTPHFSTNHAARFKYDVTAISDMDSGNLVLMQTNPVQESPDHLRPLFQASREILFAKSSSSATLMPGLSKRAV
jgi:hypothetical protein